MPRKKKSKPEVDKVAGSVLPLSYSRNDVLIKPPKSDVCNGCVFRCKVLGDEEGAVMCFINGKPIKDHCKSRVVKKEYKKKKLWDYLS